MMQKILSKVVERVDLEEEEIISVFRKMMEGEATSAQMGALLVALRMKGESISEITGAARVMLERAVKIKSPSFQTVDLCGTGGDSTGTFNISTVSSFIVAGSGIPVAKHGNRSVSSVSGSADVFEHLGVKVDLTPEQAERCLSEVGIAFLFAPVYHPAMKNVANVRKEIGIRTIFNVLGPMLNPARVKRQVVGVYSEMLLEPFAKTLRNLGSEHVMVVHGNDGLDEITLTGKTAVAELKNGGIKTYKLDPLEFGFSKVDLAELKGGKNPAENAEIALRILRGDDTGAKRDICILNAAAGIMVSGEVSEFGEAVDKARQALEEGKALWKLEQLVNFSSTV